MLVPLVALSACGASDIPLIGPCSASKRVAPDKVYRDLALTHVVRALDRVDDYPLNSENERATRLQRIAQYRAVAVPLIADGCLRAHTDEWIGFYENKVRGMTVGGYDVSSFERQQAEKEDQRRALAEKLGVRP
jgi:hypothetical protein